MRLHVIVIERKTFKLVAANLLLINHSNMEQSWASPKQRSMKEHLEVDCDILDPCRQREAADQVQRAQSESQGDMLRGPAFTDGTVWSRKAPVGFSLKKKIALLNVMHI